MHEYDASPIPTIARVARKKLKFSTPLMKDDPITTAVQNIKPHKIIAFLLYCFVVAAAVDNVVVIILLVFEYQAESAEPTFEEMMRL